MSPFLPPLLAVFFSIFHLLGGVAIGQGVQAARSGSDQSTFFLVWGAGMGGIPLIFDWFFLVAQGELAYGLVGPFVFLVSTLASMYLELEMDGPAIISAVLGAAAMLIGLFSIPLMIGRASEFDASIGDYILGSCFALIFIVIGGTFAWTGVKQMLRSISVHRVQGGRDRKERRRRAPKTK